MFYICLLETLRNVAATSVFCYNGVVEAVFLKRYF